MIQHFINKMSLPWTPNTSALVLEALLLFFNPFQTTGSFTMMSCSSTLSLTLEILLILFRGTMVVEWGSFQDSLKRNQKYRKFQDLTILTLILRVSLNSHKGFQSLHSLCLNKFFHLLLLLLLRCQVYHQAFLMLQA